MKLDIEADAAQTPSDIRPALALARTVKSLKDDIERLEDALKAKKELLHKLETADLPELMASMNLLQFKLDDGHEVIIKPFIQASIPSKSRIEKAADDERDGLILRRTLAFSWLREHHHDSLIKNELSLSFGKGEDELAKAVARSIQANFALNPTLEESVHPQTLLAFIREQLERGTDIPMDTFEVYRGKKAEIVLPKQKKSKK